MREYIVYYFIYAETSRKDKKKTMETERSGADWLGVEQGSLQMLRWKCYRVTKSELVVVMVAQLYITKSH